MPKIMLNYRPDGRRQLASPLGKLLDEAKTGLSRPNVVVVVAAAAASLNTPFSKILLFLL